MLFHFIFVTNFIRDKNPLYGSMSTVYTFPDEDDDLTNYAGGNAQVIIFYLLLLLLLAAVTYNQVQPLRINYLAS